MSLLILFLRKNKIIDYFYAIGVCLDTVYFIETEKLLLKVV